MTQRQSFGTLIAYVVLILSALGCATLLAVMDKIDSAAVMGILGGAVTGAAVLVHSTAQAAINGGPKPDLTKLAASDAAAVQAIVAKQPPQQAQPSAFVVEPAHSPAGGSS